MKPTTPIISTLAFSASAILIPPPGGQYGVHVETLELTDTTRPNPWAAQPPLRSIVISIFSPTGSKDRCNATSMPYMTEAVAEYYDSEYSDLGLPSGTFGSIELSTCDASESSEYSLPSNLPWLIFSPGLGNSRALYSVLASNIASHGFNVMTVDHPYDADILEFSDGSIILAANITSDDQILKALSVRTDDVAFLVSSLLSARFSTGSRSHDPPPCSVLVTGHSLGGATAGDALLRVPHVNAAANLDGMFFGKIAENSTTVAKPLLLFGREDKSDMTWTGLWDHLSGPRVELSLLGSQHGTFTDLPYLVNVSGLKEQLGNALDDLLGTIDALEAMERITGVLSIWADRNARVDGNEAVKGLMKLADESEDLLVLKS